MKRKRICRLFTYHYAYPVYIVNPLWFINLRFFPKLICLISLPFIEVTSFIDSVWILPLANWFKFSFKLRSTILFTLIGFYTSMVTIFNSHLCNTTFFWRFSLNTTSNWCDSYWSLYFRCSFSGILLFIFTELNTFSKINFFTAYRKKNYYVIRIHILNTEHCIHNLYSLLF